MDISYAIAWQLGRTMAMADRTFAQALVSLRGEAHEAALAAAKAEFLSSSNSHQSRSDVLTALNDLVQALSDPNNLHILSQPSSYPDRWTFTPGTREDISMRRAEIRSLYTKHLELVMQGMAALPSSLHSSDDQPNASAHWPIVLGWLLDRMKLASLPAIYLFNHPDNLPKESIRFFHIDQNWLAAQIDGALSIGNHVSRPTSSPSEADFVDQIRQEIKKNFASYIANPPNPGAICPTGGFFMRSAIVKAFPDLIISAGSSATQILSTSELSEDVLMSLMSHSEIQGAPSSDPAIVISQPPHQQRFALGEHLDQTTLNFPYKKVYTVEGSAPQGPWGPTGVEDTFSPNSMKPNSIYDWSSRIINLQNLAKRTLTVLQQSMPPTAFDLTDVLSSAAMALQLNDPLYQLVFVDSALPGEWGTAPLYGSGFSDNTKDSMLRARVTASTTGQADKKIAVPSPPKAAPETSKKGRGAKHALKGT
jgi:hypothetical protein